MAGRQVAALNDGAGNAEVAEGLCKPQHYEGERNDAEVGRGKESRDEDADAKSCDGPDERAGEPPLGGAYGPVCKRVGCDHLSR